MTTGLFSRVVGVLALAGAAFYRANIFAPALPFLICLKVLFPLDRKDRSVRATGAGPVSLLR